jgi:hypothetical protein
MRTGNSLYQRKPGRLTGEKNEFHSLVEKQKLKKLASEQGYTKKRPSLEFHSLVLAEKRNNQFSSNLINYQCAAMEGSGFYSFGLVNVNSNEFSKNSNRAACLRFLRSQT